MMGELTNEELKAAFRSVMTSSKEVHKELSTISYHFFGLLNYACLVFRSDQLKPETSIL